MKADSRKTAAHSCQNELVPLWLSEGNQKGFQRESEAPAELGVGSAGASPSRYEQCCRLALEVVVPLRVEEVGITIE